MQPSKKKKKYASIIISHKFYFSDEEPSKTRVIKLFRKLGILQYIYKWEFITPKVSTLEYTLY